MQQQHLTTKAKLKCLGRRLLKTEWIPVPARWTYRGRSGYASLWDIMIAAPRISGHILMTTQVIVACKDEVLVLNACEFPGKCTLIQGICESLEAPWRDAVRELREEALADGTPDEKDLIPCLTYREGIWGQCLAKVYVWRIENEADKPTLHDRNEGEGMPRWLPRRRVDSDLKDPCSARMVHQVLDGELPRPPGAGGAGSL